MNLRVISQLPAPKGGSTTPNTPQIKDDERKGWLYLKIQDLAIDDGTVYTHLRMQEASGMDDMGTAAALIRSLVQEKQAYMKHAIDVQSMSLIPIQPEGRLPR